MKTVMDSLFMGTGEYRLTAELLAPRILMASAVTLREWDFAELRAPYWRLYWNEREGCRVRFARVARAERLGPDRLLLIPPEVSFASEFGGRTVHLTVHFELAVPLRAGAPPCRAVELGEEGRAAVAGVLESLRHMHETTDTRTAGFAVSALVNAALATVPPEDWQAPTEDPAVARARAEIDAAFPAAVANARLAARSGLSENQLIRRFRAATGHTPRSYLQERRVREAAALMHRPELSLEMVAERTGFADRFHFTRVFTRHTGSSPARFRRGLRAGG